MKGMVRPKTYGRMGNFLFQAATAIGYALRHGMDYTLPSTTTSPKWNPLYLQHLVRPDWNPALPPVVLKERTHAYQELPFDESWRRHNVILDGYWQTEKYFAEFRPQVLEAFGYPWQLWQGFVSVHVRRGDYLQLTDKHPPVPKDWMERQMGLFQGFRYVFYSDDIEWCKQEFSSRNDCFFTEGKTEEQDLIEMSCCQHHICSASTFSWWGAYLNRNPDKRVIMPLEWFGPAYRKVTQTEDIVPAAWERRP